MSEIIESIPGAFSLASKALGVEPQELNRMLENGEIMAEDFIPKFVDKLREEINETL